MNTEQISRHERSARFRKRLKKAAARQFRRLVNRDLNASTRRAFRGYSD